MVKISAVSREIHHLFETLMLLHLLMQGFAPSYMSPLIDFT